MAARLFLLLQVSTAIGCGPSSLSPVNTTSGLYAPYVSNSYPGVASFPNIPYAENPTGPLRFAPPKPTQPADTSKVNYETELPLGCFQYVQAASYDTVIFNGETSYLLQRGDFENTTEDCLRLSVFAPKGSVETGSNGTGTSSSSNESSLPVAIFFHGGGFSIGGVNTPYQLAQSWVERSRSHIVVHVQYRLNILGLPNAAGLEGSDNLNFGLLDQRLAVEWVRDNIANFGGDADRIVLWGQSAGADAVDTYLFAWAEDPIVSGAIVNSGNALGLAPYLGDATNHSAFTTAATALECGDLSPAEELACMRKVPASDIKAYVQATPGNGGAVDADLAFNAIVDNVTVFADYAGLLASSKFASDVPMLVTTTLDEGNVIVPTDFNGSATTYELPAELQTIADYFTLPLQCAVKQGIQLRTQVGATTYQALYGGNFTDVSPAPWLGAYHTADLPMVFGTYGIEGPSTDFEASLSVRMQDLYLEFIKDPENGLKNAGWPKATGGYSDETLLVFGIDGKTDQLATADQFMIGQGCS
ncbi:Alpha/Beta hydrolase protein [Xylariaceae sp. FL1272]|nr:Alpha/Beta hydrolase protein [Xylariaceae sp. FL1272]